MFLLALSLFVLNLGDIHSTYVGVIQQGAKELNPFAAYLMQRLGFWYAVLIKEIITIAALLGLVWIEPRTPWAWWALLALNLFYLWAVGDNYYKNLVRSAA